MARTYTTEINDNEYIGDSLNTINTNFSNLDTSCQTISSFFTSGSAGVAQIIAGTNVTISPIEGTGVVTINSTGGSSSVDTGVRALTSNWESTYETVNTLSSTWTGTTYNISASSLETNYYLNATSSRGNIGATTPVFSNNVINLSANRIYEINWDIYYRTENTSTGFILSADNLFANLNAVAIILARNLSASFVASPVKTGALLRTDSVITLVPTGLDTVGVFGPFQANIITNIEVGTSDTTILLAASGNNNGALTIYRGSKSIAKQLVVNA
jgi:hypothetical protein